MYSPTLVVYVKPIGDIFINLLLTAIIPLIFFAVSASVLRAQRQGQFVGILCIMLLVFIVTSFLASIFMVVMLMVFPVSISIPSDAMGFDKSSIMFSTHVVDLFTVNDFPQLLSHNHILPLVVFSIFIGVATSLSGENAKSFARFLEGGEVVLMEVVTLIMYGAPVGFFAYFASMIKELGPKLITTYAHITSLYYLTALIYFIGMFSILAYVAGKQHGVKQFWKNVWLPAITSLATCSSAASIPANIAAANKMGSPSYINETVIPIGTVIHKDGSVMGGMLKIAFLFSLYQLNLFTPDMLFMAIGVSILVGTVMGAIPSGGMLGELLILSVYGFPASNLMFIAAISILIDPIATMINVTSNTLSTLLITRFTVPTAAQQ